MIQHMARDYPYASVFFCLPCADSHLWWYLFVDGGLRRSGRGRKRGGGYDRLVGAEAATAEEGLEEGGGGGTLGRDVRPAHRVRDCPNE